MKRILALLLALLLLTGCSTSATEENTITTNAPTETEAEASTVPETEAPTEVTTEEPTEASTEAETEAPTEAPTEEPTEAPTEPPATEPPATEHKHNYSSSVTAPTCAGKGYTTYTCTCGYFYKGNETPAKGHNYKDTVVAPACTEKGYTLHECQTCGHSYKDNETNATGHIISTKVIQQATCTETGLMQNVCENKGCSYTYDIEIEAKGHKYETTTVAPTTEAKGYDLHTCKTCGHSYKDNYTDKLPVETEPPHEHSYTSKITKAATCTEDGVKTFTCSCGDSYTETIDAKGHNLSEWTVTKEPTTESEGEETRGCAECDYYETRPIDKLPAETEPDEPTVEDYLANSHYADEAITYINEYRAANNLPALRVDHSDFVLLRAAELRVSFSHTRPNGGYIYDDGWASECIAGGYSSAKSVVDAWYNSTGGHKETMLNASYTVACVAYNGSYWVLLVA